MSEENAGASGTSAAGDQENPPKTAIVSAAPRSRGHFLAWFALLVTALSLFMPLAASGIWDPPEREVAELGRRIALNLLGGHSLAIDGSLNEVPTRSELRRGELPFTSIAAGFRVFGLHEWAGRLPLAIWGVIGLAGCFLLVRRLADARAAWFSVLVLATMPLYFLHARTMLGDIVTMASLALALAGLGLAVFDRGAGDIGVARWLAVGLGVLGMLCAVLSRGALVGVAVPASSVGASWLVLRGARVTSPERFGDVVGALALAVGVAAGYFAWRALLGAPESGGAFSLWLGSVVNRPRVLPTFDSVLLQLGHALFPWSAVVPVALGCMLRSPPVVAGPAREREAALRVLALALPISALFAYSIAAPVLGQMPFGAVSALAIAVALFMRDFERGVPASRALPMLVCAFAILLLGDFKNFPEKGLSAFVVNETHFPDSFKPTADHLLSAGTLLTCAFFFYLLQERSSHEDARFEAAEYRIWPRTVRELWAGNLQFALLVFEVACVGVCVLGYLGEHVPAFKALAALGTSPRASALKGALLLPTLLVLPPLLMLVRDAFRTLFDPDLGSLFGSGMLARGLAGGLSRAQAALVLCVGFGLCLSLGYYPLLAVQISPKQVFEVYRSEAHAGEALGMLGPGAASATYYAGRTVPAFDSAGRAFDWLMTGDERRWLVIRDADLPALNSLYRARRLPAHNLPVRDAGSSEILLVSNRLGGARNDNPLARYLPEEAPSPTHVLSANLGDKLDVLGWDTFDLDGKLVTAVEPGHRYTFVIYYRVTAPISGTWETFIHVDGFQRRFNGDHPTLEGKYPFGLWHVGDFIADRCEFALEPFFGAGRYRVYLGLYSGSRRLEVRRGRAEENRLEAGFLDVR